MTSIHMHGKLALGAFALTIGFVAMDGVDARAASRRAREKRLGSIVRVDCPMGARRYNDAVVLPFVLLNESRRLVTMQVEYGFDRNGDGVIADGSHPDLPSEYTPASQNRADTRDTSRRSRPLRYRAGLPTGVAHAFSWNASHDMSGLSVDAQGRLAITPQGRPIRDPDHPEDFLRETGEAGVRFRIRSIVGQGHRRLVSPWAYSGPFTISNNTPPEIELGAAAHDPSFGVVVVDWTAYDSDSEDTNGDGVLDVLEGEDRDQDGDLDRSYVSVAFDYHRLGPAEDPTTMTQIELEGLVWKECSRRTDFGDSDAGVESSWIGTPHAFGWDYQQDVTAPGDRIVFRARPYDGFEYGATRYWLDPVVMPGDLPE